MIYTITFSPSIDYVINSINSFDNNGLNRINDYQIFPGGKGINASVILKRIGFDNQAITFLGGKTKNLFMKLIDQEMIKIINIGVNEDTRINVKFFSKNANFEINGKKPQILKNHFDQLNGLINQMNYNDIVFIMGISDENYVLSIINQLYSKKIKFILDIDSPNMTSFIKFNPFIIKPNLEELESIYNQKLATEHDIKKVLHKLKDDGCINAMVSNGSHGSYLINEQNLIYKISILNASKVISTVGAGDTLISAFTMLYLTTHDIIQSLKYATSLSIGTVTSKWLASKQDLTKYLNNISVTKISD